MVDIAFSNYFGNPNDFDNLKKWFRVNTDIYKELLTATKERCDLELEYSNRLLKIGQKYLKAFSQTQGSVGLSWTKAANLIIEESDIHKNYSNTLSEEIFKPLSTINETFSKSKKPVEADIDKCYKTFQDKIDEEMRLKKKAHSSMRDSEKAFESVKDYLKAHPTSVQGNDRERAKIEKRAYQMKEASTKAEVDYYESSLAAEEIRHKFETNYLKGLEKLQNMENERLNQMVAVLNSYHKCLATFPSEYIKISDKLGEICRGANIENDLLDNVKFATNKSPTKYKTEQFLLELYSENNENTMDQGRRLENLSKRISVLYQSQKMFDNMRVGALKMIKVYEDKPKFADDATKAKTRYEYSKNQAFVNWFSANIYKFQVSFNKFNNQPEPSNPLIALGMQIVNLGEKGGSVNSMLISNPGSIMSPYEPCNNIIPNDTVDTVPIRSKPIGVIDDDVDVFDTDDEDEVANTVNTRHSVANTNAYFNQNTRTSIRPVSQMSDTSSISSVRPLPSIPTNTIIQRNRNQCRALHGFTGRDQEELTFNEGDTITIVNKVSNVWWEGELHGKRGLIPVSYVSEMT